MNHTVAPRFGYARLTLYPSSNSSTPYTILKVDDRPEASKLDNSGFYIECFPETLEKTTQGLHIHPDKFTEMHGRDVTYLYKVNSPEMTQAVEELNELVRTGVKPGTARIQSILNLLKDTLGLGYEALPEWVENLFNLQTWRPQEKFLDPISTGVEHAWEVSNRCALNPAFWGRSHNR